MGNNKKILVYGYGNPGRRDDGLGITFSEAIEKWAKELGIANITCESNYQLNIEDADLISAYDLIMFADASVEEIDNVTITKVCPSGSRIEFSMHAVSPSFVLDLCNQMYGKAPQSWLIHLKGYEWEFGEGLSIKARENIEKALEIVKPLILNPDKLCEKFIIPGK